MKLPAALLLGMLAVLPLAGCAQETREPDRGVAATAATPPLALKDHVVDVGCAMCMFGMPGVDECRTAIRVDGVVFLAKGVGIPDAEDHSTGVCRSVRKARVSGSTSGDTFTATSFVMLP